MPDQTDEVKEGFRMEIMEMIRQLYSVEELQGYTEDEIAFVKRLFRRSSRGCGRILAQMLAVQKQSIECRIFGRNRKCSANRSGLETATI